MKPTIYTRPELLQCPPLPKMMHGVNPRSIWTKYRWDKERRAAYAKNNYCCEACGTHKDEALFRKGLEAHEECTIDYGTGRTELKEIVALCNSCHSFIHSYRLHALMGTRQGYGREKVKLILKRGMGILKKAGLEPFYGTALLYCDLFSSPPEMITRAKELQVKQAPTKIQNNWSKWHLILEGEKHYSKFKNEAEWREFYG